MANGGGTYGALTKRSNGATVATRVPGQSEYLFKYLIITQICMYLEAGAVPSLLQQFTLTFHLSPQEQGLLGAVVYISISLASPWCSTLFRKFDPRQLLGLTLAINNLAVLTFACTPASEWYSKTLLISLRAFIGFTQAFHCVYSPLWVHEYAPRAKRGSWMSFLQAATPIGITLGYFAGSVTVWLASADPSASTGNGALDMDAANVTSSATPGAALANFASSVISTAVLSSMKSAGDHLFDDMAGAVETNYCQGMYCWRWPFIFQFLAILPFSVMLFFVPVEHIRLHAARRRSIIMVDSIISTNDDEDDEDEDDDDEAVYKGERSRLNQQTPLGSSDRRHRGSSVQDLSLGLENLRQLFQQKVFVFIVLGLSALFFVVAGVQFWTTLFLATNTNDSLYAIHSSYLIVSGTGPILGVFFGGWLIDQFGGYAGLYQRAEALRVCMVLGGLGCLASLPVSFFHSTPYIAIFLWLMLFCGGSILPACSGIVISSAPRRLRPLASSVAYASYNLLGYAASNYIPGLIMNFIIDDNDGAVGACDTACTYRIGFRIVLLWSVWAFFCLTCAYTFAKVQVARKQQRTAAALESGRRQ
ncbi:hypothetical protein PybrP1_000473 [[Pythium] brassicae (nom. inval.)]|nr:hypothetical protein PybrP1_000473 [[Pythium] brassicae (nom. inval.)]